MSWEVILIKSFYEQSSNHQAPKLISNALSLLVIIPTVIILIAIIFFFDLESLGIITTYAALTIVDAFIYCFYIFPYSKSKVGIETTNKEKQSQFVAAIIFILFFFGFVLAIEYL